jgi:acetolactate synthase-1/2/3 large subunit
VERQLPIVFLLANNGSYGSIRLHQERGYPGRVSGTSLFNPDFHDLARSFGMASVKLSTQADVDHVIAQALHLRKSILVDVNTSLDAILP